MIEMAFALILIALHGFALNLGTIYAFIPIFIIILLIGGAASLTRGSDILAFFGMGAVQAVGRGGFSSKTGLGRMKAGGYDKELAKDKLINTRDAIKTAKANFLQSKGAKTTRKTEIRDYVAVEAAKRVARSSAVSVTGASAGLVKAYKNDKVISRAEKFQAELDAAKAKDKAAEKGP